MAPVTPNRAGMPNSRATLARWPANPPCSEITAAARATSGAQVGRACSTTSTAPSGNWRISTFLATLKTLPEATPGLALMPPSLTSEGS